MQSGKEEKQIVSFLLNLKVQTSVIVQFKLTISKIEIYSYNSIAFLPLNFLQVKF